MKIPIFYAFLPMICLCFSVENLSAQVIQLPTLRVFNVRTSVSVPDGGTINLGGVNRSASGSISRGTPGLPGPLFNSRGIGQSFGANRATVTTKIIVMSELEEQVLAEARRRREAAAPTDPNGPVTIQNRADFITRNIGRSRKR